MSDSRLERLCVALYAGTMLLSAGLLFWIQPLMAKLLLPRFGGAPAVWTVSLLFYQALLLLGYFYAHKLGGWRDGRSQAKLHCAVALAVSCLLLPPRLPDAAAADAATGPLLELLRCLLYSVAGPVFLLSSTAPLLQGWFSRLGLEGSSNPYPLYAASNLGSLGALAAFPFLLEPTLASSAQLLAWGGSFLVWVVLLGGSAWLLARRVQASPERVEPEAPPELAPGFRDKLRWLLLSLIPASLVYGITTMITTDLAPVPLLWVLPLALYLLGFVLAFSGWAAWLPARVAPLLPFILLTMIVSALQTYIEASSVRAMLIAVTGHLIGFFLVTFELHRRLAELRPAPGHLTHFYLWVALGGVLGGLLNALAAPVLFKSVLEYPLGLLLACLLLVTRAAAPAGRARRWMSSVFLGAALVWFTAALGEGLLIRAQDLPVYGTVLLFLILARQAFGMGVFSMLLGLFASVALIQYSPTNLGMRYVDRSFFGTHRVFYDYRRDMMVYQHGTTLHGRQSALIARRHEPLSYFSRSGPLGQVFSALDERFRRVGVVGLGTGTVAAYARPGQRWTFFEIDPMVRAIAENDHWFTYLADMQAPYSILLGDGRLSLGKEGVGPFDLLILDAFSSDSIPLHLLTREAIELYLSRLEPGGVLALNITNRYLELEPLLASHARAFHLAARVQYDIVSEEENEAGRSSSKWVILARDEASLGALASEPRWSELVFEPSFKEWTDDFSNLLGVLRRRG